MSTILPNTPVKVRDIDSERMLIRDRYGRPGRGNDKGSIDGLVGYARRNFMVPIPHFGRCI